MVGPQAFCAHFQILIKRMWKARFLCFYSVPFLMPTRAPLTRSHIQKPRLPLPDRILRRFLHWPRYLGLPGPRQPLCLCRRRPFRHRSCIRYHGLGLRRHLHLYKSRS